MAIDWRLGVMPDVGTNALAMFERGEAQGREDRTRNALAAYTANPNEQTFGGLAQNAPEFAMRERGRMQEQQVSQRKQQQEQMVMMGRLLDHAKDPQTYAQSLAAAQQAGIDVSTVPQQYDPAWVDQQRLVVRAFNDDGGEKISGIARELVDAGYDLATPKGQTALRSVISNKYASEYVDASGNTRRRSALNLEGAAPTSSRPAVNPPRPEGLTDDQIWTQAHEAVRNGANADDVFRRLQDWGMKP